MLKPFYIWSLCSTCIIRPHDVSMCVTISKMYGKVNRRLALTMVDHYGKVSSSTLLVAMVDHYGNVGWRFELAMVDHHGKVSRRLALTMVNHYVIVNRRLALSMVNHCVIVNRRLELTMVDCYINCYPSSIAWGM